MFSRLLISVYGLASYAVFLASFVYALGFFGNTIVPKSVDSGAVALGWAEAVIVDGLLLGLFAIQHSVMARRSFKDWWAAHLTAACQRSTYVLLSSLLLLLLFWQWQPIPAVVWTLQGTAGWAMTVLYWAGWLLVLASSYMIDHFDLFGLRQTVLAWFGPATPGEAFRTPLLYRIVRHPLMLGFLVVFWAAPVMSAGHLLLAVVMTLYILAGLQLEERDLIARFGAAYRSYRQSTPMLLPWPFGRGEAGAPR